jgi:hypothetical protein
MSAPSVERRHRSGMPPEDRSWVGEAAAGERIDDQLAALPSGWVVVSSVDLGDRRPPVECVVIGPGGVFTVLTADHSDDRVWIRGDGFVVNGEWMSYLREIRREANRVDRVLSTALGLPVLARGVVALVADPDRVAIKRQPDDVHVAAPGTLRHWLTSLPPMLDVDTVERIQQLVRRSAAWSERRAG